MSRKIVYALVFVIGGGIISENTKRNSLWAHKKKSFIQYPEEECVCARIQYTQEMNYTLDKEGKRRTSHFINYLSLVYLF